MAFLLADEDVSRSLVDALRRGGHDVITVRDIGLANRRTPDGTVIEAAAQRGRALLTMNRRDFRRLHQSGVVHAGMLLLTRTDAEGLPMRVRAVLDAFPSLEGRCINVRVDRFESIDPIPKAAP